MMDIMGIEKIANQIQAGVISGAVLLLFLIVLLNTTLLMWNEPNIGKKIVAALFATAGALLVVVLPVAMAG